jgi:hypothetical protein
MKFPPLTWSSNWSSQRTMQPLLLIIHLWVLNTPLCPCFITSVKSILKFTDLLPNFIPCLVCWLPPHLDSIVTLFQLLVHIQQLILYLKLYFHYSLELINSTDYVRTASTHLSPITWTPGKPSASFAILHLLVDDQLKQVGLDGIRALEAGCLTCIIYCLKSENWQPRVITLCLLHLFVAEVSFLIRQLQQYLDKFSITKFCLIKQLYQEVV